MDNDTYIRNLEAGNHLSGKAIRAAIDSLGLFEGASILDVPCGIGSHAIWMAEKNNSLNITGVDFSEAHLEYAQRLAVKNGCPVSINFEQGDINDLCYDDNSFDFIWCCDGLWSGKPEMGCLCEQPYDILNEFSRITRPGGMIAILFWSSQKLLPGFPFVEAALNDTLAANIPMSADSDPDLHFMRAPLWLKRAGLTDVQTRSFVSDISAPFDSFERNALNYIIKMFWQRAEPEVDAELWEKFTGLISRDSAGYILDREGYTAFITYTMFTGTVA